MSGQSLALDDLGYELQLLLGADEIVGFIEAHDNAAACDADRFGNLVNYFKDSIYLHSRNLLNAFTEHTDTEIGKIPDAIKPSATYRNQIKPSLERYVMHLESARDRRGTVQNILNDGRHLNDHVHDLTADAKRCWNEWTAATGNQRLMDLLEAAEASAQSDVSRLRGLMQ